MPWEEHRTGMWKNFLHHDTLFFIILLCMAQPELYCICSNVPQAEWNIQHLYTSNSMRTLYKLTQISIRVLSCLKHCFWKSGFSKFMIRRTKDSFITKKWRSLWKGRTYSLNKHFYNIKFICRTAKRWNDVWTRN